MVKNWAKRTPDNSRFTAKFPKVITHDKHLVDVNEEVFMFLIIWNHYKNRLLLLPISRFGQHNR
jgi:uncharacterized protein YecE (DUF72 family)